MIRIPSRPVGPLFAALALFLSGGCGEDSPPSNRIPTVELISGPVEGSEVDYRIDVSWLGADTDGTVDHYEYAVDPPAAFTEKEVASGGPGIVTEVIPGTGGDPTVTRVSKTDGSGVVFFDWVHTVDTSRSFRFSATEADSTGQDSLRVPTGRFTGMHALYVRAVDDEEAVSPPDHVAFTATTVAPTSRFTRPALEEDQIIFASSFPTLAWAGEDPDGAGAPTEFLYTWIPLKDLGVSLLNAGTSLFNTIPLEQWTLTSSTIAQPTLAQGELILAVRAVDEAGAVEPFIEWGRNAVRIYSGTSSGPKLTVYLGEYGAFLSGYGQPTSAEVPVDQDIHVSWTADTEAYLGTLEGYSWGLDIADLEDDRAWSPWGLHLTRPDQPLRFRTAGIHVLYVRARDTAGTITLVSVPIQVADFPFDREVLLVDDSYDDTYPRDGESDAFWASLLANHGDVDPARVGIWEMYGPQDRGSLLPTTPSLGELGRYRTLVWDIRGSGYNGVTGLSSLLPTGQLQAYLRAGGQLWLSGRMTLAALTAQDIDPAERGDFNYPKLGLGPGDFAWDFLKLRSTRIDNDRGSSIDGRNNLSQAQPIPDRPEIYPLLEVDTRKQNPVAWNRGIPHCDAIFDPLLVNSEPGFRGTVDSLYVYGATGNLLLGKDSVYHRKLTGLRWHDADPDREHGRIQWFGFPMYFMQDAQAQETFNRSLDWFREETPATP